MIENIDNNSFFTFKVETENKKWVIPIIPNEGSDSINIQANWTTQNVQGSTEAIAAFNYVNNPTLTINLKFHEDLWRTYKYKVTDTYDKTVSKLASLPYPGGTSIIQPPYVKISYADTVYRGYFTSMRITQSGPMRDGHRVITEISAQFIVSKSSSPNKNGVAGNYKTYFGS
nr:hypothetical protein DGKKSRWO_DGKKSRWO_CDS_0014 [uncultured phage]CAI9752124.1 hypothetical protein CVNMHQAP_CVNMHQAP_CDS_0014 [uncultured phage]